DGEEHAQRPHCEADDVQLRERQRVEAVRDRNARERGRPAEVGGDHRLPPAPAAVDPRAREQREEEVRPELSGTEEAHLARAGVEEQEGGERQRDDRDLIAEEGDRLPDPERAELALAQERRNAHVLPAYAATAVARAIRMSPETEFARKRIIGPPSAG